MNNNTVGNCYFECKSKNYLEGGCANMANFFFGLSKSLCLCLCYNIQIQHISSSSKCNSSCGSSIDNGECGGVGHLSVYSVMNITVPEAHFRGFCLTCRSQSDPNSSQLYSMECNENITGYCVLENNTMSLQPIVSNFASYWRHCKGRGMHIVRDTNRKFCQKDSHVWTGLRKYKIDNSNTNQDICYDIEINQETINYKKRNCTENENFLCKREIGSNHYVSNAGNLKRTTNTVPLPLTTDSSRPTTTFAATSLTTSINGAPHPTIATSISTSTEIERYVTAIVYASTFSVTSFKTSINYVTNVAFVTYISPFPKSEEYTAAIVGTSIAGVIAMIFVVFLIICLLKRRRFQCMQSKQHQSKSSNVFKNTTNENLVESNQKQNVNYANTIFENDIQGNNLQIDGIYVEKEEEYDHLHTSRQKKATIQTDDDIYGTASYLEEDSYFTLRQNKNDEPDLDNGYSVNNMLYSKNQLGSVNSPVYDYCYQSNQRKDWL